MEGGGPTSKDYEPYLEPHQYVIDTRYLRDNLNGYGLVMLHYPDVPMPEAAIKRDELIEMIQEYDNVDEERAKKRAKASKL